MLYFFIAFVVLGFVLVGVGTYLYFKILDKMQIKYFERLEDHYNKQRDLFRKVMVREFERLRYEQNV